MPAGINKCSPKDLKRWESDSWRFPPYHYKPQHLVRTRDKQLRYPTPEEKEVLYGFPRGYTGTLCNRKEKRILHVRLTDERHSMIGNTWCVQQSAWILLQLLVQEGIIPQMSPQEVQNRCNPRLAYKYRPISGFSEMPDNVALPKCQGVRELEEALVQHISDGCVYKGSDVSILPGGVMQPKVFPRMAIPPRWWTWKTIVQSKLVNQLGEEHINALELRAYLSMLRWRTRRGQRFKRFLHLKDSQVNLAILAKGRTSAVRLAPILERASALIIVARLFPIGAYCPTKENPADDPSRLRRLRGSFK